MGLDILPKYVIYNTVCLFFSHISLWDCLRRLQSALYYFLIKKDIPWLSQGVSFFIIPHPERRWHFHRWLSWLATNPSTSQEVYKPVHHSPLLPRRVHDYLARIVDSSMQSVYGSTSNSFMDKGPRELFHILLLHNYFWRLFRMYTIFIVNLPWLEVTGFGDRRRSSSRGQPAL